MTFDTTHFDIAHADVRRAVEIALAEDIGAGDVTTEACIPPELLAEARFVARQQMVLAGVELLNLLFDDVQLLNRSGDNVSAGVPIAIVHESARICCSRVNAWR